jgi:hypothetical protein
MQKKNFPTAEILFLIVGELIVSLIVSGVYLLLDKFSVSVISGCLLGSAVAILNFVILSVSVNRAIDKAMAERGTGEMTEEEAAAFAQKNAAAVQRADCCEKRTISAFVPRSTRRLYFSDSGHFI